MHLFTRDKTDLSPHITIQELIQFLPEEVLRVIQAFRPVLRVDPHHLAADHPQEARHHLAAGRHQEAPHQYLQDLLVLQYLPVLHQDPPQVAHHLAEGNCQNNFALKFSFIL